MINVLDRITKQRQMRGWSEYLLAEKSELPQSTISSWYRKHMFPSFASLDKICMAFDMTMSQFLSEGESVTLTDEQKLLIERWSYLNKEQKEVILKLMQIM